MSHCCRSEYDGDLQSQLLSKANEEDKNCSRALSVVSAVVRAAKDLLHRAFAVDGKPNQLYTAITKALAAWMSVLHHFVLLLCLVDDIPELLSSSSLFSMLLPLILAYIGPVAASVPKV